MAKNIFEMMAEENIDTMKVRHDSEAQETFFAATGKVDGKKQIYDDQQSTFLFETHNLTEYVNQIKSLLNAGKHYGMDLHYCREYDIRYIMNIHSIKEETTDKLKSGEGPADECPSERRSRPVVLGGTRRYVPGTDEFKAIKEGLDLARGMSYKNIAAGIDAGGCKAVVIMDEPDICNDDMMKFLAYANECSNAVTAPDMNLPVEMSDVMKEKGFSTLYVGGAKSKTGVTGKATAYGLVLSMKEALRAKEGSPSLKDKKVVLIGLGAVGKPVAEYLIDEGVKLTIAARNRAKAKAFLEEKCLRDVRLIDSRDAIKEEADILCPCATGGVVSAEDVNNLKFKYIWGAANNQIKTARPEDELVVAEALKKKGILFQAEWWHNCGGIMCMAEEYYYNGDEDSLHRRIEETIPVNTRRILTVAAENDITPTKACYDYCDSILCK